MLDIGTNIITKNKVPLGHGYASSYLKSCTTDLPGRSINAVIHFQISLLHIITVLLVFFCIVCFFHAFVCLGKERRQILHLVVFQTHLNEISSLVG